MSDEIGKVDIAVLELRPGDILLVRVPVSYSPEMVQGVHKAIQSVLDAAGKRAPVLVGPNDVELQVVRRGGLITS